MQTNLTEPCSQCPFRRASAPGWLGPWEPTELLASLAVQAFPCHPTIKHDGQDVNDPTLEGCAGAAIFLNNKREKSRCGWTLVHQAAVEGVPDTVRASVFANRQEFVNHHASAAVKSWELMPRRREPAEIESCEICEFPTAEGRIGCDLCGRLFGPCCNSVIDDVCVECVTEMDNAMSRGTG